MILPLRYPLIAALAFACLPVSPATQPADDTRDRGYLPQQYKTNEERLVRRRLDEQSKNGLSWYLESTLIEYAEKGIEFAVKKNGKTREHTPTTDCKPELRIVLSPSPERLRWMPGIDHWAAEIKVTPSGSTSISISGDADYASIDGIRKYYSNGAEYGMVKSLILDDIAEKEKDNAAQGEEVRRIPEGALIIMANTDDGGCLILVLEKYTSIDTMRIRHVRYFTDIELGTKLRSMRAFRDIKDIDK